MAEYDLGPVEDFPEGSHRLVTAGRMQIGVFNLGGEFFALPNICPHQFGPLCAGKTNGTMVCSAETGWSFQWRRQGEILTCPWLGIEFDIRTGKSLASPRMWVRPYGVEIREDRVVVTTARVVRGE
jgi:nitrite reductase/ring-hydroxylating ferredoxin subunit